MTECKSRRPTSPFLINMKRLWRINFGRACGILVRTSLLEISIRFALRFAVRQNDLRVSQNPLTVELASPLSTATTILHHGGDSSKRTLRGSDKEHESTKQRVKGWIPGIENRKCQQGESGRGAVPASALPCGRGVDVFRSALCLGHERLLFHWKGHCRDLG